MRESGLAGAGALGKDCATEAPVDTKWVAEHLAAAEDHKFNTAFQTLLRASQYRADVAFMDRLRVWLRGKRAELDGQLNEIGL